MKTGWVRAYSEEYQFFKDLGQVSAKKRSKFRKDFTTTLFAQPNGTSTILLTLHWGDVVQLPNGIGSNDWVEIEKDGNIGYVLRSHLVEVGYINNGPKNKPSYVATLETSFKKVKVIWGDLVQILSKGETTSRVRIRNWFGYLDNDRISPEALLEVYFIDVGQGDGILIKLPEGKHMLIDGGLSRKHQMTGKNAGDFVDWKFFADYGHYEIHLDGMMSSHSDADHYGGLWDLVANDIAKDKELDVMKLKIDEFYHPGLSRWQIKEEDIFPHKDDLGPNNNGWFVRLLQGREDAEACVDKNNAEVLKGNWKEFIEDILKNPETQFFRLGVREQDLTNGLGFPEIWKNLSDCVIKVLAPVTKEINGMDALKDLGDTGKNTNGHSICLRLDYGHARILLTGDLNSKSMDWLSSVYDDRIAAFNCDVAKACHHGSHDISFSFLDRIKASATVICSGDSEGYAHPRPEVVAASAITGYVTIDRENDRLKTPLIYMTEIERSVSLGKISHIRLNNMPVDGQTREDAIFAEEFEDISDLSYLTWQERQEIEGMNRDDKSAFIKEVKNREKPLLENIYQEQRDSGTKANFHYQTVHKWSTPYGNQQVKGTRIMTKNHYGLVNVRTDGKTIMCATMKETADGWSIHTFPARFDKKSD